MAMLLGKKIGMTRIYDDAGAIVPVTVIQVGPCKVLQVKTVDTDGYDALQLGFDDIKPSQHKIPMVGHCKAANTGPKRFIREWRLQGQSESKVGDELTVSQFGEVAYVDIAGTTKGKGFQGVVRRHGFKSQGASHGVERKHRSPGGIGICSGSKGRGIKKGKHMAGHMGHVQKTSQNHKVIRVDVENNLLIVKGAVAGPNNSYVTVANAKTKS